MLKHGQARGLPKAKLLSVRWSASRTGPRFMAFRNANARLVFAGPFVISWRMPWLEKSARALHPECFED